MDSYVTALFFGSTQPKAEHLKYIVEDKELNRKRRQL
jgi:hypothetical protein